MRCLDAGIDEYMTKPFDFKDLYKKINMLLDKRRPLSMHHDPSAYADALPLYDLGLLRQMDDRQYLWDRLNAFITDSPGQIAEMQSAAAQGDHEKLVYWACRIKRSARVLQSHVLLGLLGQIEFQSKAGEAVDDLILMVEEVYEGLEQQLQEEKEKIGFVLSLER